MQTSSVALAESSPLPGLEFLDSKTFSRVWDRVMPDATLSPVVVRTPQAVEPIESPPREEGQEAHQLEHTMDALRQLSGSYMTLSRRSNGRTARTFLTLADGVRRLLRQVSAQHFLLTGHHYIPLPPQTLGNEGISQGLRSCFLLERQWMTQWNQWYEGEPDLLLRRLWEHLRDTGEGRLKQLGQLAETVCAS